MSVNDPMPPDEIPYLDPDLPDRELLLAIVKYLEGPPRLLERLIRLERIVIGVDAATKLAGSAGDKKHRRVIIDEAGKLVIASEDKQAEVNLGIFAKLSELFGIASGLQAASLRLFGVIALGGAVVIYVLARALGA